MVNKWISTIWPLISRKLLIKNSALVEISLNKKNTFMIQWNF